MPCNMQSGNEKTKLLLIKFKYLSKKGHSSLLFIKNNFLAEKNFAGSCEKL